MERRSEGDDSDPPRVAREIQRDGVPLLASPRKAKRNPEAMRLGGLEARELFSFQRLSLNDLPSSVVVVGPNGSGKTNLVRLLEIVRPTIERATYSQEAYHTLVRFAQGRRFGAPSSQTSVVRIGISLTED